jgi:hypothetical protein
MDIKMKDINNSNDYDDYLKSHVESYMVTEFLGRGQYNKVAFTSLEDAKRHQDQIKSNKPNARIIVYGLSKPPHTNEIVSIAIG